MRQASFQFNRLFNRTIIKLFVLLLLMVPFALIAQEDSTASTEDESLISPSLQFQCVQKSDNSIDLKTSMLARINGWPMKLQLLKISFFQVTGDEEKGLGFLITDKMGKGVFNVKPEAITPDKDGAVNFKAVFAGNNALESVEEELTIKRAKIEISPVKEDSLLTVQVKISDATSEQPVSEATVGIFVKRLFRPLKIGEGTTDENGEASIEIPNNLPGNAKGEITLLARLDEDETYGYLEASAVEPWGVSVSDALQKQPRALWSKNPPLWMLITFIILMTAVWGHYIVIIYELFRLRKEQPKTEG